MERQHKTEHTIKKDSTRHDRQGRHDTNVYTVHKTKEKDQKKKRWKDKQKKKTKGRDQDKGRAGAANL